MGLPTLQEINRRVRTQLIVGVIEEIIIQDPMYNLIPFVGYAGTGAVANRESSLGDAGFYSRDDTITHNTAMVTVQTTFTSTRLIGDVLMDGLDQMHGLSADVDQIALEVASKAKNIGQQFQRGRVRGTGTAPEMNSFHSMVDSSMYVTVPAKTKLTFALLDKLIALIKPRPDFIEMSVNTSIQYKQLLRDLGGTAADWAVNLADGTQTNGYSNIPVFINDQLLETETENGASLTGGDTTSVWAGKFDDGTMKMGLCAVYPKASTTAGVKVVPIGQEALKDQERLRVIQYANWALFNKISLARLPSILQ